MKGLEPYSVVLWVYAEDEREVKALQNELHNFVSAKYNNGVYIKASTLRHLLEKYGNNLIVNTVLRG